MSPNRFLGGGGTQKCQGSKRATRAIENHAFPDECFLAEDRFQSEWGFVIWKVWTQPLSTQP